MIHAVDVVRNVEGARRSLARVRRRLLHATPEALEDSLNDIHSAILSIRRVEMTLCSNPETKETLKSDGAALDELSLELAQVTALLQNAVHFYSGWALLALPQEDFAANYTSTGASVARPEKRLVLHG